VPRPCWYHVDQTLPRSQVWLGKTVADFATYRAIILGDGSVHSTTDGALLACAAQTAYELPAHDGPIASATRGHRS